MSEYGNISNCKIDDQKYFTNNVANVKNSSPIAFTSYKEFSRMASHITSKLDNNSNSEYDIILNSLKPNLETGMSYSETYASAIKYGKNELNISASASIFKNVYNNLKEPLTLFIIFATIVEVVYEQYTEGCILATLVIIGIVGDVYFNEKARQYLIDLQSLKHMECMVLRDGEAKSIHVKNLVVKDIVFLYSGDTVPADILILKSIDLLVDEKIITGDDTVVLKEQYINLANGINIETETVKNSSIYIETNLGQYNKYYNINKNKNFIDNLLYSNATFDISNYAAHLDSNLEREWHINNAISMISESNSPNCICCKDINLNCMHKKTKQANITVSSFINSNDSKLDSSLYKKDENIVKISNVLLSGTTIIEGNCVGIVISVGKSTYLNRVSKTLATINKTKKNFFIQSLNILTKSLGICALFVVVFIFLNTYLIDYHDKLNANKPQFVLILQLAVCFALCTVPESLPTMVTYCLAKSSKKLLNSDIIVQRLSSILTLASLNLLCVDKIGTLTYNEIIVKSIIVYSYNKFYEASMFIDNAAYKPVGHLIHLSLNLPFQYSNALHNKFNSADFHIHRSRLATVDFQLNKLFKQIDNDNIKNNDTFLGSLSNGKIEECTKTDKHNIKNILDKLVAIACLLSATSAYSGDIYKSKNNDWKSRGNPIDAAIKCAAIKLNLYEFIPDASSFIRIPFTSLRRCQAAIISSVQFKRMGFDLDSNIEGLICLNGDLEHYIQFYKYSISINDDKLVFDCNNQIDETLLRFKIEELQANNLRLLGLFIIPLNEDEYDEMILLDTLEYRFAKMLTLTGYLAAVFGLYDSSRPNVEEDFKNIASTDIELKILTGDSVNSVTTFQHFPLKNLNAINVQNLYKSNELHADNHKKLLLNSSCSNSNYDKILDEETIKKLLNASIYYAANVNNKMNVIKELQKKNYIVGMIGDGLNDLGAINAANISIAMGTCGADQIKTVSEVILTKDKFNSFPIAIFEGRTVYSNIQNFALYTVGNDFASIIYLYIPIVTGIKTPLTAIQILLNNLITSIPAVLSLALDKGEEEIKLYQIPQSNMAVIPKQKWLLSLIPHIILQSSVILAATTLYTYVKSHSIILKQFEDYCSIDNKTKLIKYCFTHIYKYYSGWVTEIAFANQYSNTKRIVIKNIVIEFDPLFLNIPYEYLCNNNWCEVKSLSYNPYLSAIKSANSMSYLTTVTGGLIWIYSIRSSKSAIQVINRTQSMHTCISLAFTVILITTSIPYFNNRFDMNYIGIFDLLLSISLGFIPTIIEELTFKRLRHSFNNI